MEDGQSTPRTPSEKNKLKQTICLSFCLPSSHRCESLRSASSYDGRRLVTWLRSRAHEFLEISRRIIGRIGGRRRLHSPSAEYNYDPLSYSLNFDAGGRVDEALSRNFPARSPQLTTVPEGDDLVESAVTSEITCL